MMPPLTRKVRVKGGKGKKGKSPPESDVEEGGFEPGIGELYLSSTPKSKGVRGVKSKKVMPKISTVTSGNSDHENILTTPQRKTPLKKRAVVIEAITEPPVLSREDSELSQSQSQTSRSTTSVPSFIFTIAEEDDLFEWYHDSRMLWDKEYRMFHTMKTVDKIIFFDQKAKELASHYDEGEGPVGRNRHFINYNNILCLLYF